MKKVAFATAAIAAMALTTTASAQAENWSDKGGGLSLGVDQNFGLGQGAGTGLAVRYFISDAFGLELLLGGDYASVGTDDGSASAMMFDIGLLGEYRILKSQRANLNAYLGIGINYASASADDEVGGDAARSAALGALGAEGPCVGDGSCTDMAVELGLRAEVWLYTFFSIYTRVGISIDMDGEDLVADDTTSTTVGIFRGDLLGTAGFSFWFK